MRIATTGIAGVHLLSTDRDEDDRGWFLRVFDADVLRGAGLHADFPQHSVSHNTRSGTVRGLHLQHDPHGEIKVIRCSRGRVFDVIVDLRTESATFGRWESFELSGGDGLALHVGTGLAHGFQALEDETELAYLISTPYEPAAAGGVRWDDPTLGIPWPQPVTALSARDRQLPTLP